MTALSEVQARQASVAQLQVVVGAMSGIAAAHAQRARSLLPSYRAYADAIGRGLADAVALARPAKPGRPSPSQARILVVFGAEHGFAGDFSGRVLRALTPRPQDIFLVLGARAIAAAEQQGLAPAWTGPAASQASAVAATARQAADALFERLAQHPLAAVEVVFATAAAGTPYGAIRRSILPLDLAAFPSRQGGSSPLTDLPSDALLEAVVGEHIFAELALAALESFASENAARLAAMQSARFNIERKLEEMTALERRLRQDAVTAEVQEVVAGALTSARP